MEKTKSVRSQALDLLRFPLACVVVTIHVFAGSEFVVRGETFDLTNFDVFMAISSFARAFLNAQSVPVYFFIAGYVFFLGVNLNRETYLRKMKNRFRSLFIPYILWNALSLIAALIAYLPALHSFFPGCDWQELHLNARSILSCFWVYQPDSTLVDRVSGLVDAPAQIVYCNPINGPMWFVRDLMIVALFTPAINFLLRRFGAMLPALTGMLWFCVPNLIGGFAYGLITALFFFSFGAYFSFNRQDMVEEFRKYRTISYYVYIFSAIYLMIYIYMSGNLRQIINFGFVDTEMIFVKNITIVAGLFFAYNIAVFLIEKYGVKSSKVLSSAAFFIYASHWVVMDYVKKIISLFVPPTTDAGAVAMFVATDVVLCGGLLLLYVAMKRYTPRILSPFIGGRL